MKRRAGGILLHLTSLPSAFGIGDMGPAAYRFADFLAEAGQSLWQMLPLNPTPYSPYHSYSAFAGNPLLISPELLQKDGLLDTSEIRRYARKAESVDYRRTSARKRALLDSAYRRFKSSGPTPAYQRFCSENAHWLEDYCLFVALNTDFPHRTWNQWPSEIRRRRPKALEKKRRELDEAMDKERFQQYIFFDQWMRLKQYCHDRGIQTIGDIPIYVTYHSSDVWANPDLFRLDRNSRPSVVAGVPPDYFSDTGQRWGNPVYRWEALKDSGYQWWYRRFSHNLSLFDIVRVDHFRGLVAYWEVPARAKTAINGRWVEVPAYDFFDRLMRKFPCLPIIAEDLGFITPDVREVMQKFNFPGMKVLLFAFGEDLPDNPYIPHNFETNCVAYTGTHDTNTIRGWYERETTSQDRARLMRYLGRKVAPAALHWELIGLLMRSVADTVIVPMQDLLGLGEAARMNRPATKKGNWQWRLPSSRITSRLAQKLRGITEITGRA